MLDGIEANLADVQLDAVEKEHLRQRAELIRWLLNWDQTGHCQLGGACRSVAAFAA